LKEAYLSQSTDKLEKAMVDVTKQLEEIAKQTTLDSELDICRKQIETLNLERQAKILSTDSATLPLHKF
jgi:hypothetical protein